MPPDLTSWNSDLKQTKMLPLTTNIRKCEINCKKISWDWLYKWFQEEYVEDGFSGDTLSEDIGKVSIFQIV